MSRMTPAVYRTIFAAALALAAAAPATFHDRVIATYAFSPHTLKNDAEFLAKSKDLDAFWQSVKAGGPAALDDLRKELARPDAPTFFSYDGSKLLLSMSSSIDDKKLALGAIARTDLHDLQPTDYFLSVHALAVDELDTSDAALKILGDPKFKAFIAQHALTLDQDQCLTYMLLPTKEAFYLDKAQRRLFVEKDVTAQKSLLSLLAHTVTKSGDEAIARFAAAPDQPEESRQFAKKIIGITKQMESATVLGFSLSSYDALKEEQRKLFAHVSDEALIEWEHLRVKLRRKGYPD